MASLTWHEVHLGTTVWGLATDLAARPAGPLLATAAIAVAGVLFIPITLLGTTALAVFGAWPGIPVVWVGAVLAATVSHAVGARWGTGVTRRLPRELESNLRRMLQRRPFWAVVLMRVLPLGNFGALNLLAGAAGIPRRSFVIGNAVGLAPGLLGLGLFVNRALAALRQGSVAHVIAAVAIAGATVMTAAITRRRLRSAAPRALAPGGPPSARPRQ